MDAVGDGLLELVGCARRAAGIVVLDDLDRLAVEAAVGVDALDNEG